MFIIILTMGQRIVISESEKNHIKNLYESDKLLNDIQKLKKQINDMKKYKKTEGLSDLEDELGNMIELYQRLKYLRSLGYDVSVNEETILEINDDSINNLLPKKLKDVINTVKGFYDTNIDKFLNSVISHFKLSEENANMLTNLVKKNLQNPESFIEKNKHYADKVNQNDLKEQSLVHPRVYTAIIFVLAVAILWLIKEARK